VLLFVQSSGKEAGSWCCCPVAIQSWQEGRGPQKVCHTCVGLKRSGGAEKKLKKVEMKTFSKEEKR
jgi:hypothetical protein